MAAPAGADWRAGKPGRSSDASYIAAIFYPFSQFCEIGISLLSLQKQLKTAPNLFQRGVEYGKYVISNIRAREPLDLRPALIVGMSFYSMGHSEKASGYHGSGRLLARKPERMQRRSMCSTHNQCQVSSRSGAKSRSQFVCLCM